MNILEAYRSPDIAIIALNVNDLNAPVKRQRFTQWIKKHHPVGAVISDTEYSWKFEATKTLQTYTVLRSIKISPANLQNCLASCLWKAKSKTQIKMKITWALTSIEITTPPSATCRWYVFTKWTFWIKLWSFSYLYDSETSVHSIHISFAIGPACH